MFRNSLFSATRAVAMAAGLSFASLAATAAPILLHGSLDDTANLALVGSCPDVSTCNDPSQTLSFDPAYVANNVALYTFHLAIGGTVDFLSTGYAPGGIKPYFTLFSGIGGLATFLDSNYNWAYYGPGGDFHNTDVLGVGDYTVALGAFGNLSLAENLGSGTLADGFAGIGNGPIAGHNFSYALSITTPDSVGGGTVPEPSTLMLVALSLSGLAISARRAPVSTKPELELIPERLGVRRKNV